MLNEIIWGIVQGLTEFLPVSSSGHLVLIPALLGIDGPDLATSALLHVGTLVAVIAYYRRDLANLLRFRTDHAARRTLLMLAIATAPAVLGAVLGGTIESLQESTMAVSIALIVTGLVLYASGWIAEHQGTIETATPLDALLVGLAQVVAFVPGISRSGMTITAGMARGLDRIEAARLSFLMAIPAIAGAAIFEGAELAEAGGITASTLVGVLVAGLSGYAAIAVLIRALGKVGLRPFAIDAVAAGIVGLVAL